MDKFTEMNQSVVSVQKLINVIYLIIWLYKTKKWNVRKLRNFKGTISPACIADR